MGASGYSLSQRFYLLAQRASGAARTGSVFAFAPFIGAAVALTLTTRSPNSSRKRRRAGSITVRHLLTHTSGILDYDERTLDYRKDYTEEELARRAFGLPLKFPAGAHWSFTQQRDFAKRRQWVLAAWALAVAAPSGRPRGHARAEVQPFVPGGLVP